MISIDDNFINQFYELIVSRCGELIATYVTGFGVIVEVRKKVPYVLTGGTIGAEKLIDRQRKVSSGTNFIDWFQLRENIIHDSGAFYVLRVSGQHDQTSLTILNWQPVC